MHERFEFDMPASVEVVFDTFHYHCWRMRWDTLVNDTRVIGGAPCPSVGAVTENIGGGWLRGLSMRTRFITYERPRIAAASMIGRSFPFTRWAASMQHRAIDARHSIMIYTYTFEAGPAPLRWLVEPVVKLIFDRQTRKRFGRMRDFLEGNAGEVERWQDARS